MGSSKSFLKRSNQPRWRPTTTTTAATTSSTITTINQIHHIDEASEEAVLEGPVEAGAEELPVVGGAEGEAGGGCCTTSQAPTKHCVVSAASPTHGAPVPSFLVRERAMVPISQLQADHELQSFQEQSDVMATARATLG